PEVVPPVLRVLGEVVLVQVGHREVLRRVDAGVLDAGRPGEVARSQPRAGHLSPVVATPATKYFCAKKNATAIGMSEMVAPASRTAWSVTCWPPNRVRAAGRVSMSGSLVTTSGQSRSFHRFMKLRIATVAMAG